MDLPWDSPGLGQCQNPCFECTPNLRARGKSTTKITGGLPGLHLNQKPDWAVMEMLSPREELKGSQTMGWLLQAGTGSRGRGKEWKTRRNGIRNRGNQGIN